MFMVRIKVTSLLYIMGVEFGRFSLQNMKLKSRSSKSYCIVD